MDESSVQYWLNCRRKVCHLHNYMYNFIYLFNITVASLVFEIDAAWKDPFMQSDRVTKFNGAIVLQKEGCHPIDHLCKRFTEYYILEITIIFYNLGCYKWKLWLRLCEQWMFALNFILFFSALNRVPEIQFILQKKICHNCLSHGQMIINIGQHRSNRWYVAIIIAILGLWDSRWVRHFRYTLKGG